MNRFLILILIALSLILFWSLFCQKQERHHWENAAMTNPSRLLLGDSRLMAISTPHSRTIALPGEPFFMNYQYLKRLIDYNMTPEIVIINVSPGDLFSGVKDERFHNNRDNWFNANALRMAKSMLPSEYFHFQLSLVQKVRILGAELVFGNLKALKLKGTSGKYYAESKFTNSDFNPENSIRQALQNLSVIQSDLETSSIKSIKSLCTNHDIKLVILETPMHSSFWEEFPEYELSVHDSIISSLAESDNVHYVQLSPRNQQVDNSLFYDATHLNQKGGDFFSTVLDSILLQY